MRRFVPVLVHVLHSMLESELSIIKEKYEKLISLRCYCPDS